MLKIEQLFDNDKYVNIKARDYIENISGSIRGVIYGDSMHDHIINCSSNDKNTMDITISKDDLFLTITTKDLIVELICKGMDKRTP